MKILTQMRMNRHRLFLLFLAIVVIGGGLLSLWLLRGGRLPVPGVIDTSVSSFEECLARGFAVLESYPRQCKTNEGAMFTEDIGNELEVADDIRVTSPRPNDIVQSPIRLDGEAVGGWYFEASFPVRLVDANGYTLALRPATAKGDWMTESFVPFSLELPFAAPSTSTGTLILTKDNPSGLPEYDAELRIPVRFFDDTPGETMSVQVFLSDEAKVNEPPYDCGSTLAVTRIVPKSEGVGRAALEALLRGVTQDDTLAGRGTSIPAGVRVTGLTIENGVATVDFDDALLYQMGGACRTGAVTAQITDTLRQFPSISSVVIRVNGDTNALQP